MKTVIIIILFLFVSFSATSQTIDTLNYDYSSNVEIRTSEKINTFLNDDFYKYNNEIVASQSIWNVFFRWLAKLLHLLDTRVSFVSYFFYIAILTIFVYAIIKLLGINMQSIFLKSKKINIPEFEVFDEDIYGINFENIILKSEKAQDFKTAIRYLYILFLKVLTERELIEWKINKTNIDYRNEIINTKHFSNFKYLTLIYEYVWYGEFSVDKTQYKKYKKSFEKTYKELS